MQVLFQFHLETLLRICYTVSVAEVAELADAHGSGPCDSNVMRVQVPSSARLQETDRFLFFICELLR